MTTLPNGTRIGLAAGLTDMRRGLDGLAAIAQKKLGANSTSTEPLAKPPVRA
jgi:transposase